MMMTADDAADDPTPGVGKLRVMLVDEVLAELDWWASLQQQAASRDAADDPLDRRLIEESGGAHEIQRMAKAALSNGTRNRVMATVMSAAKTIRELLAENAELREALRRSEGTQPADLVPVRHLAAAPRLRQLA